MAMPGLALTVLVDNTVTGDENLMGEAGLAFLITTGGEEILFDTGLSGLFLSNAEKLGIRLEPDVVVLSHGHNDHTGGLPHLTRHLTATGRTEENQSEILLIAHPRCFWRKRSGDRENGAPMSEDETRKHFAMSLSQEPVWITEDLVFLGEIPRLLGFEEIAPGRRQIQGIDGTWQPDLLLDDSALAYRSRTGLVIITGCSHAGICNILEYARKVTGEARVRDIIGGFHLIKDDPVRHKETAEYLGGLDLAALHACHCTSLAAKIALAAACPIRETSVGLRLEW
jgi:7,8-dihydropterin-6-yl-methyl-4-(beta-D-ribofuranosyl)aminobenzene 5'-phosphate synthase